MEAIIATAAWSTFGRFAAAGSAHEITPPQRAEQAEPAPIGSLSTMSI